MALDFKRMLAEARRRAMEELASPKEHAPKKADSSATSSDKDNSHNKKSLEDYLSLSFELQPCKIEKLHNDRYEVAPGFRYIPNFLTEEEEKQLLEVIYDAPDKAWVQISTSKR